MLYHTFLATEPFDAIALVLFDPLFPQFGPIWYPDEFTDPPGPFTSPITISVDGCRPTTGILAVDLQPNCPL